MEPRGRLSRRNIILITLAVLVLCIPILLPVVIFLFKFFWPRLKYRFENGPIDWARRPTDLEPIAKGLQVVLEAQPLARTAPQLGHSGDSAGD